MAWWEQPWIWQIVAPILGTVVGGILVYYLLNRESLKIRDAHMTTQLQTGKVTGIELKCWFSLLYKGSKDRYLDEISLELNKRTCEKLRLYCKGYVKTSKGGGSQKLEPGKPQWFGFEDFFPARRSLTEGELKQLDDITQELWHRYKIGWKDTYGKSRQKTINQLKEVQKLLKM